MGKAKRLLFTLVKIKGKNKGKSKSKGKGKSKRRAKTRTFGADFVVPHTCQKKAYVGHRWFDDSRRKARATTKWSGTRPLHT